MHYVYFDRSFLFNVKYTTTMKPLNILGWHVSSEVFFCTVGKFETLYLMIER